MAVKMLYTVFSLIDDIKNLITIFIVIVIISVAFVFGKKLYRLIEKEEQRDAYLKQLPEKYSCFNEDELYEIYRHIDFLNKCKKIGYAYLDNDTSVKEMASSIVLEKAMKKAEKHNGRGHYVVNKEYIESDIAYLKELLSENYYV